MLNAGVITEMTVMGARTGSHVFLEVFVLAIGLVLSSCSASVASTIRADGGARISVQAEVPAPLAAKLRKLASAGSSVPSGPFFDAAAIRKSIAARPGMSIVELSLPGPDAIRAEVAVRSLEELAASPDLAGKGLMTITRTAHWAEFRFRLERGGAKALAGLFPGVDPYLMDALSPPAIEDDPVTSSEYRTMLKSVLGAKAMVAMDAATIDISISAPGSVTDSGGGSLSGSTLTAKVPLVQALTLEKPIELWLRWRQ
jgi:hypothetical protein